MYVVRAVIRAFMANLEIFMHVSEGFIAMCSSWHPRIAQPVETTKYPPVQIQRWVTVSLIHWHENLTFSNLVVVVVVGTSCQVSIFIAFIFYNFLDSVPVWISSYGVLLLLTPFANVAFSNYHWEVLALGFVELGFLFCHCSLSVSAQ